MFALRSGPGSSEGDDLWPERVSARNPNDWLTVEQAACELGVSDTTVRRRLRRGLLPSRTVPRKGGFAYRIYLPESRHGRDPILRGGTPAARPAKGAVPIELSAYRRRREQLRKASHHSGEDPRIEGQPERLPESLLEALSLQPRPLAAAVAVGDGSPFEQYRQLVRRRRWWPF